MKKTAFICAMALILAVAVTLSSFIYSPVPTAEAVQDEVSKPTKVVTLDFSLNLLRECAENGENALVSPLCAAGALTTAALGADGDTKTQLENVLVSNGDIEALALSLGSALSDCSGAVSVWANNDGRLELSNEYADSVKNSLNAEISFTDFGSVIDKMDAWVQNATDGRIESVIDDVPPEAVMYILSALTFDGEWVVPYTTEHVAEGAFTAADGTVYDVPFMKSTENIYIETELATGFAKPYTDGSYFVAMLPNEGVSMTDMLASLDGETFRAMMENAESKSVSVCLPKFTAESELSLSEAVMNMGAPDAFSMDNADFSPMGSKDLYISDFMQNTYLSVDEKGTQGGAASGVEVSLKSLPSVSVVLNRPFAYFIVKDGELLFAGVLERF